MSVFSLVRIALAGALMTVLLALYGYSEIRDRAFGTSATTGFGALIAAAICASITSAAIMKIVRRDGPRGR
jgi:hypothetical protein